MHGAHRCGGIDEIHIEAQGAMGHPVVLSSAALTERRNRSPQISRVDEIVDRGGSLHALRAMHEISQALGAVGGRKVP